MNVYLSEAGEAECNCYMVVVAVTTLLLYIRLFMNVMYKMHRRHTEVPEYACT